jgi:flagellar biosynthesis protein FlhF
MRIKTFYAKTMAAALREVKAELGHDALLLSSKEIPSRSGIGNGASGYEVVAAIETPEDQDLASPDLAFTAAAPKASAREVLHEASLPVDGGEDLTTLYTPASLRRAASKASERVASTRKEPAKRIPKSVKKVDQVPAPALDPVFSNATMTALFNDLVSSGIQESLARKLLQEALRYLAPRQRRTRAALLQSVNHVAQRMIASAEHEDGTPGKRVVVFVGPTGVGKTTSIAKLGAHLALQKRKKIVFMTLDGYRIGAVEQLRTYASLMGIPFRFVSEVADLPKAIREHSQRDYILIDTAGRAPKDLGAMEDLAEFLKSSSNIERHLVLSATTKASDLREIVDRFEICKPDHLLFTKLDETSTLGPILNELVRSQKAPSYYSDGQRVPEDLHAAPREQIVDLVLNRI